jgi:glucose-1-phosphate adenylyltransferase
VERSVLFDNVEIGRHCTIRNAIIDKNVNVPDGTQIGVNLDEDRARGFSVTERGVVAVPKSYVFR